MQVLLIEDDPLMGETLSERLQLEGFRCQWLRSGQAALASQQHADVVVSDIKLPDTDGPTLMKRIDGARRSLPWIFITGYGTVAQREQLLAAGANDFFTKPLDLDRLVRRLRALQRTALDDRPAQTSPPVAAAAVLGVSGEMRRLHATIAKLGANWNSVLVTGESGAGKEELARCLHRESADRELPFVAVNAASLPESLIEAELFGYEKGAFTGAMRAHRGKFEQAQGGTIFLDEIGDMPLTLQARLLRVIQDRTVTRLGAERPIPVQVRLIFATHKHLNDEVRAGRFREDLYYRINVVHLHVPPLRARPEDIAWLAHRFVGDWNLCRPGLSRRLTADGEQVLLRRSWPGNVRELRNAIERACLLSDGELLDPHALAAEDPSAPEPVAAPEDLAVATSTDGPAPRLDEFLRIQERAFIRLALARHDWQIGVTAEALGISRKNLWERMKRLAIG
jgi:DNA-binding NtrC family response regulator